MRNIGLLGFGVVGEGVYALTRDREDMGVAWVLCRKEPEIPGVRVTHDIRDILEDPQVDTVVEALGGLHPAYEYVTAAIRSGRDVVTSNKALMTMFYDELIPLARECGVCLRCTAAVGGGISWLSEVERTRRIQTVQSIHGIMNGTCNYILDNMTRLGLGYDQALRQAQKLGYAERDPSTDVEGTDTWHKLILSANIAFAVSLDRDSVPVSGIHRITAGDVERFTAHGLVCKLVGQAGEDYAFVQPTLYPRSAPEASVSLNYNLLGLTGNVTGPVHFYGQGAGRYPTAYNVVQDLVDIRQGKGFYAPYGKKVSVHNDKKMCYYVRGGWDGDVKETWNGAVITQPIAVKEMHRWLSRHPDAFIAAIYEK